MTQIAHILVPLDLHRVSEAKIPAAVAQARAFEAEIILLHVNAPERPVGDVVSPDEAQARTHLDAIAARLHGEGIAARTLIRWGDPAETILDEIGAQGADLVVLGSTRRQGLSHLWLGSVAENIVARATCPVLLVRPPHAKVADPPPVRTFGEDAARTGPVAPRDLGLRTVEVARIVGSVGRAIELDGAFRSRGKQRADTERLQRIVQLMKDDAALPPVDLYKLGYGYYVLDGNHRVAAALAMGQLEIDAHVTEFMPLGDLTAQRVAAERRAFERTTGLMRVGVALPGHYQRLDEMIRAYAAEHGLDDLATAARRWDTAVYRPVAATIRRRRLTQRFPGERTADVFVRAATVRDEASHTEGRPLPWDDALARL